MRNSKEVHRTVPTGKNATLTRCLKLLLVSLPYSHGINNRPWLDGIPTPLPLLSKKRISSDTHLYRFSLTPNQHRDGTLATTTSTTTHDEDGKELRPNDPNNTIGIPICSCLLVSHPDHLNITRPYTPVSSRHEKGSFVLLVKQYPKGEMGRLFGGLSEGDSMLFWQIPPNIKEQYPFGKAKAILMLAAGTGITPMYQALQRLFGPEETTVDENVDTKVILLYGSRTEKDIFLQKELEDMSKRFPDRLEIIYALSQDSRITKDGMGIVNGRIDQDLISRVCREKVSRRKDCQVWVCGPSRFYDELCGPRGEEGLGESCILKNVGFSSDQVVKL